MVLTDKKWNPDYYYLLALDESSFLSNEDARAWYEHPCTKYLIYTLTGDIAAILQNWASGAYTDKSIDATAQENAKNIGKVQNLEDLLQQIHLLGKNMIKGENEDDRTSGAFSNS